MITAYNSEKLLQEAIFKATTSGGKGCQNVNKVATRVELYFNIENSTSFTDEQKAILNSKLYNRISGDGILRITSSEKRSQLENKEVVKQKFRELIRKALTPKKKRKQTAPSRSSIEERLRKKKLNSERKSFRAVDPGKADF